MISASVSPEFRGWYRIAFCLLALIAPTTIFWAVAKPLVSGILPLYVTPEFYLSDLGILFILFVSGKYLFKRPAITKGALLLQRYGKAIFWPFAAILVFSLASSFQARSADLAIYTTLRWLISGILFLALVLIDFSPSVVAKPLVLGLTIQSLIGIGQVLHGGPLGLPGELALGLQNPDAARVSLSQFSILRAYGLTFHPNVLGGFIFVGLLFGIPLLKSHIWRLAWGVLILGLILSFSRSAWLAGAIMLPIITILLWVEFPDYRRVIKIALITFAVAGIGAGFFLHDQILTRLQPFKSYSEFTSLQGRGELVQLAQELIKAHPFLGIGAGNFPLAQSATNTLDPPHYVHNIPLLLASEIGIVGGLLWLWLWLRPLFYLSKAYQSKSIWLTISILAWIGIGIIGLWDFYPWALESGRLLSIIILASIVRESSRIDFPLTTP